MKPLTKYIPEANIEKPMEGRRMGELLQWLNSQIKKLKEVVSKLKKIIYEVFQK